MVCQAPTALRPAIVYYPVVPRARGYCMLGRPPKWDVVDCVRLPCSLRPPSSLLRRVFAFWNPLERRTSHHLPHAPAPSTTLFPCLLCDGSHLGNDGVKGRTRWQEGEEGGRKASVGQGETLQAGSLSRRALSTCAVAVSGDTNWLRWCVCRPIPREEWMQFQIDCGRRKRSRGRIPGPGGRS